MIFPTKFSYLISNDIPFFHITICLKYTDSFPFLLFGKYGFTYLALILFYQAVGSTNNGLCGTIVLLQLENFRIRICLRKVKDIINIRSTKRVNALCIIANNTNMLIFFRQLQNNAMLRIISILILINEYISELVLITCQYFRIITK